MIKKVKFISRINHMIGNIILYKKFFFLYSLIFRKKSINFHNLKILIKNIDQLNILRLFFNMYEKAEINFVKKYFINIDTIDLGCGIGCASGILTKKFNNYNFKKILVDFNKDNIKLVSSIFNYNKLSKKNLFIINKIFTGDEKNISFTTHQSTTDLTSGKIIASYTVPKTNNKTTNLLKIITKYKIKHFQAIIDIEGEEFNFSKKTFISLKKCKKLIIEIHSNNPKKIKKLINNLLKLSNLKIIDQHNYVYYLENCET